MLKGIELISYAREFPEKTELPFRTLEQMPKAKVVSTIVDIEKCELSDNKLVIYFSGKAKINWEFECPSQRCARQWVSKIEAAMLKAGNMGVSRDKGMGGLMDSRTQN